MKNSDSYPLSPQAACYVAVLRIGKFWDTADITRIFNTTDKAMKNIPKGFKKIDVGGYFFYAENERTGSWLTIKTYEVEY